jgi:hypothetical protein
MKSMPPPKVSESAWQAQLVQLAHTFGWLVQHTRPAQHGDRWMTPITGDVGFPDLVLVHPQRGVVFAELKTDRGAVSEMQYKWGRAIRDAGGEWRIWRPKDIDEVIKRLGPAYKP